MHIYVIQNLTPAVTCGTPVAYLWVAAVVETAPRKAAVLGRLTGAVGGGAGHSVYLAMLEMGIMKKNGGSMEVF